MIKNINTLFTRIFVCLLLSVIFSGSFVSSAHASADKVQKIITLALNANYLSKYGAGLLLSRRDNKEDWSDRSDNITSLGSFVDRDEYNLIQQLYSDVLAGKVKADPEVAKMLKDFVDRGGPDSRLLNIAKYAGMGFVIGGGWFAYVTNNIYAGIGVGVICSAIGAIAGFLDD